MTSRSAVRAFAGVLITAGLWGSGASAAPPGDEPSAEIALREQALALYEKGMAHLKNEEYREAHDALQQSLALKKTRGAMGTAASCLKQLGRYDEALTLYEEVLREFPDPDPQSSFRKKVDAQIAELQGLVGTLVVAGDAPDGATLLVDERRIGVLPPAGPLRVSVGMHHIRVEKEGFDPITATIEVRARQESVAELVAPSRKGLLVVSEAHNWPLHVELDGKDVGVTPWQGSVEAGEHQVRLHGFVDPDALEACAAPEAGAAAGRKAEVAAKGARMLSPERAVTVRLYVTERVMLGAEEQDASLRIESTPGGARLWIDGKEVGRTPWAERLSLGEHAVEVRAAGFVAAKQSVTLERRKQRELTFVLTPLVQRRRPGHAEAVTSVMLLPSFGGDVIGTCDDGCALDIGAGATTMMHAGINVGESLSFGLTVGYLAAAQRMRGRSTTLTPTRLPPHQGSIDERLALRGGLLGGWIGRSLVEGVPLRLRLGAGVLLGTLLDERSNGSFRSEDGTPYGLDDVVQRHAALFLYAMPEVRAHLPLGERIEVSAGVALPVLIDLGRPRWDTDQILSAGRDGSGTFASDTLMNWLVVAISAGIGARYEF